MRTGNNGTRGTWEGWFHWIVSSFVTPAIAAPVHPYLKSGTSGRAGATVYICGCEVTCVPDECPETVVADGDAPIPVESPVVTRGFM